LHTCLLIVVLIPLYALVLLPRSLFIFSFSPPLPPRLLPSFPTRRSSDLPTPPDQPVCGASSSTTSASSYVVQRPSCVSMAAALLNRKSTRLNSSHVSISYAVFCLKKKKK